MEILRKLIYGFIILVVMFQTIEAGETTNYISVYQPNISLEKGLVLANKELQVSVKKDEYFYYVVADNIEYGASQYAWNEYGLFSSNKKSGKYKYISELNRKEYEFIGKTQKGDLVPNPYYTPDSKPTTEIMGRWKWIQDPEFFKINGVELVSNASVDYKKALTPTDRTELFNQIILALEHKFGPMFNEGAARAEGVDAWLSRAGIIIPPTKVSRGMIRLWHSEGDWYTTAIINPLYYFQPDFKIVYDQTNYTDGVIVTADTTPATIRGITKNTTDLGDSDVTEYIKWTVDGVALPLDTKAYTATTIQNANINMDITTKTVITMEVKIKGNPQVRSVTHTVERIGGQPSTSTSSTSTSAITSSTPGPVKVTAGNLIIASNSRGNEIYDVTKAIPTGEYLYVNVFGDSYMGDFGTSNVSGSNIFTATMTGNYKEADGSLTPFTETRSISRSYSYKDIAYYYLYKIDSAKIYNYALTDGMKKIYPKSGYNQTASHSNGKITSSPSDETMDLGTVSTTYDFDNKAQSMIGSYGTTDGTITLNGATVNLSNPFPKGPLIANDILYQEGLKISASLANKESMPSRAELIYTLAYNYNTTKDTLYTHNIGGNPLTVLTPVVCYPTISNKLSTTQLMSPDLTATQLMIGDSFTITYPTSGQHLNIPGYGNRDYGKTTDKRQIRFSFDVYEGNDDKGTYLKAGDWNTFGPDNTTTYFIPNHNYETTSGQIQYRTLPINFPSLTSGYNYAFNNSVSTYKAVAETKVQLSSLIYDFKVSDVNDPNWTTFYKQSATDFYSGLTNYRGTPLSSHIFTLPILPGKNTIKGYGDYAIKLGYKMKFNITTNGDMTGSDDVLLITPTYTHVDSKGNKQAVDLYYESSKGFIALGSTKDTMKNTMILNHTTRGIPLAELQNTAKVLASQGRSNGLSYQDYLNIFTGQYEKDIAYNHQILLTEAQKTYVGKATTRPAGYSEEDILSGAQRWYGEFYLPNQTVVVPKGTDLKSYQNLRVGKAPFLTDGYIIVNFDIKAYHDIKVLSDLASAAPYNAYKTNLYGSAWAKEGYDTTQFNMTLKEGDIAFYHVNKKASDDYK